MSARIHDAVTAVLSHGDEIYLTRRQPHLAAFPGYWAFPGGKVDKDDGDAPLDAAVLQAHPPRLMRALARELQEETGLDLVGAAKAGAIRAVACLGEVTTPSFAPLRFRAWCYRVDFHERPPLVLDPGEASEAEWVTAAALERRFAEGKLLVAPPTRAIIGCLAADPAANCVPGLRMPENLDEVVPWVEMLAGLRVLLVRSHTLPPADRTNAFWLGDTGARRVLVDPAPSSDVELERLCTILDEWGLDEVFLTHHHIDHCERADAIARRYRVPIGSSADTRERITRRSGGRFFEGVEHRAYAEGDVLTHWLGQPVSLYAVPGHDEGQLALMPAGREWCVVSDLIQGVGTVVIASPEGNMRKYFRSLERVIELDPATIIPSHGLALGSTHYLKQTLAHRRMREQQVHTLHQSGVAPDAMVGAIYPGLDPQLLPFARMNVDSHLAKLREEGRLGP